MIAKIMELLAAAYLQLKATTTTTPKEDVLRAGVRKCVSECSRSHDPAPASYHLLCISPNATKGTDLRVPGNKE